MYFSCAGLQERGRLHPPTEVGFKSESGLCEDLGLPEVKRHRWRSLRGWEKLDAICSKQQFILLSEDPITDKRFRVCGI